MRDVLAAHPAVFFHEGEGGEELGRKTCTADSPKGADAAASPNPSETPAGTPGVRRGADEALAPF